MVESSARRAADFLVVKARSLIGSSSRGSWWPTENPVYAIYFVALCAVKISCRSLCVLMCLDNLCQVWVGPSSHSISVC